jgi:hypothetical protein
VLMICIESYGVAVKRLFYRDAFDLRVPEFQIPRIFRWVWFFQDDQSRPLFDWNKRQMIFAQMFQTIQ